MFICEPCGLVIDKVISILLAYCGHELYFLSHNTNEYSGNILFHYDTYTFLKCVPYKKFEIVVVFTHKNPLLSYNEINYANYYISLIQKL